MNMVKLVAIVAIVSLMTGCASSPDSMQPTYVSPLEYRDYNCDQISSEMNHVSRETNRLYNSLEKKSNNDNAQMAAGMLLFWPALFFLEGGDGAEASQYSQLKGEFEALRTASVERDCSFDTSRTLDETVKENLAD